MARQVMARQATVRYLESIGLNPNRILEDGVTEYGYYEIAYDKDGKRMFRFGELVIIKQEWPAGFSWIELMQCLRLDGIWPGGEYRP